MELFVISQFHPPMFSHFSFIPHSTFLPFSSICLAIQISILNVVNKNIIFLNTMTYHLELFYI